MTDDLFAAVRPLLARLDAKLSADPAARAELLTLARAVVAWLDAPAPEPAAPPPVEPEPPKPPLPPITFHLRDGTPPPKPVVVFDDEPGERTPVPLPTVAARCRVKAEACRLKAAGRDATAPEARDLFTRADALPDCGLWMLVSGEYNNAPAAWADLAAGFAVCGSAADLLRIWRDAPPEAQGRLAADVLPLAAEAQSTLMAAAAGVFRRGHDPDQLEIFWAVSNEARRRQVYVRRFLKREDRADPTKAADLERRIADAAGRVRESSVRGRDRKKLLNNIRYKLTKMADDPAGRADDWPQVLKLLDELVADGLPASNADVRELLLPVIDYMPDALDVPANADAVFRAADEYLATRPPADDGESKADRFNADVGRAADLLAGTTVVLIGGQERPARRDALARAFRLTELLWLTTREHTSITYFEPYIARPDTAVVLLAIRWSSHDYAEVQQYCDKYDKRLVRLPAGYHPNQVAHQILSQVGDQLAARRAASAGG